MFFKNDLDFTNISLNHALRRHKNRKLMAYSVFFSVKKERTPRVIQ